MRFLSKLVLLTLLLLLALNGLEAFSLIAGRPKYVLETFLFMMTFTATAHFALLLGSRKNRESFIPWFMGLMVLKLTFYGAYIFVIIYLLDGDAQQEVILFLALYLSYLVLEVIEGYRLVNLYWSKWP